MPVSSIKNWCHNPGIDAVHTQAIADAETTPTDEAVPIDDDILLIGNGTFWYDGNCVCLEPKPLCITCAPSTLEGIHNGIPFEAFLAEMLGFELWTSASFLSLPLRCWFRSWSIGHEFFCSLSGCLTGSSLYSAVSDLASFLATRSAARFLHSDSSVLLFLLYTSLRFSNTFLRIANVGRLLCWIATE